MVPPPKRASLTRQLLAFGRRQPARPSRCSSTNAWSRSVEKMLRRLIGEHITLLTRLERTSAPVMADQQSAGAGADQPVRQRARRHARRRHAAASSCQQLPPGDPNSLPGNTLMLKVSDTGTGIDSGC